jgi:hypothetical protein
MSVLSDELSKPEYAGLSDQQAADAVNAKTEVVTQFVPIWQMKQHAITSGYWLPLKVGQADQDANKAGLCISVMDWISDVRMSSIDVHLPEVAAMIGGLVAFQIMTQSQADQLVAMGSKMVSWTSTVGLPEIGIGLVINARKEIAANEVTI